MPVYEMPIIAAKWQDFTITLGDHECRFTVKYSRLINRWSFDLEIDGDMRLQGQRMVPMSDLVAGFGFGIGEIRLINWGGKVTSVPGLTELPSGEFRFVAVLP